MLNDEKDLIISKKLQKWYNLYKRDLPWRDTKDPYIIWISEIILQQTRVDQGMDYFYRFMQNFPTVMDLANADEEAVLKCWQGLGYYSRARNLHAAAIDIKDRFNGMFPNNHSDILSLKGVGEYTAAAITSFAWNMPYAVVDGNVFRVLSRLFAVSDPIDTGKGKKIFTALAQAVMDDVHADTHNQAIMEFGALHCTPNSPNCLTCPLQERCMAFNTQTVQQYPVKQQKIKTQNRYLHYFHVVTQDNQTFLHRRDKNDIWKGLFEFPLVETIIPMDFEHLKQEEAFVQLFKNSKIKQISLEVNNKKHILSHRILYANFYRVELELAGDFFDLYQKIAEEEIDSYAVSRLMHIYLEKMPRSFEK